MAVWFVAAGPGATVRMARKLTEQLAPGGLIFAAQQGDSLAGAAHPPGPAYPMGEQRGGLGQLVVDHAGDMRHIEAAGSDVRGDEDRGLAAAEGGHHPLAGILAQVALECHRRVARRLELPAA